MNIKKIEYAAYKIMDDYDPEWFADTDLIKLYGSIIDLSIKCCKDPYQLNLFTNLPIKDNGQKTS